jgi:hypothetical protein
MPAPQSVLEHCADNKFRVKFAARANYKQQRLGFLISQASPPSRRNTVLSELVKPNAAKQVFEAGIAAQRIKEGVHFKELQNVGLFLVGSLEGIK